MSIPCVRGLMEWSIEVGYAYGLMFESIVLVKWCIFKPFESRNRSKYFWQQYLGSLILSDVRIIVCLSSVCHTLLLFQFTKPAPDISSFASTGQPVQVFFRGIDISKYTCCHIIRYNWIKFCSLYRTYNDRPYGVNFCWKILYHYNKKAVWSQESCVMQCIKCTPNDSVKTVGRMTYIVLVQTLNHAQSTLIAIDIHCIKKTIPRVICPTCVPPGISAWSPWNRPVLLSAS